MAIETASELLAFLQRYAASLIGNITIDTARSLIRNLRAVLPLSIDVSYYLDEADKGSRIKLLFSANRNKAKPTCKLVWQCNGLIAEVIAGKTANILTMPPHNLTSNPSNDTIRQALGSNKYYVYPVEDGTIFNLSYDAMAGRWIRSTKNAFDIDPRKWREHNYKQAIDEVFAAKLGPLWASNLATLNKALTYSLGFQHPAFHPYRQPAEWIPGTSVLTEKAPLGGDWLYDLWLVQVTDRKGKIYMDTGVTGINRRQPLTIKLTVESLRKRNEDSIDRNHFGYILRSIDATQPDYLLESRLFADIRSLVYQREFVSNKLDRIHKDEHFKHMTYVVLSNFLNSGKRDMFIALFPQYKHRYELFDAVVSAVASNIYDKMIMPPPVLATPATTTETTATPIDSPVSPPTTMTIPLIVDTLVTRFDAQIRNQYQCAKLKFDKGIINALVVNNHNADVLYPLLKDLSLSAATAAQAPVSASVTTTATSDDDKK